MWKWIGIGVVIIIILVGMRACGLLGWWAGETVDVAKEEFGPRALLEKYEFFKDVAAALDAKNATIAVYEVKLNQIKEDYKGVSRRDWDRTDKENMNLWMQEVAGIKASFNILAAEFNAAMAKFNYAFCEVGTLPQGATEPLPRKVKPYKIS